jgi:predicted PurR-regulated permease PerM
LRLKLGHWVGLLVLGVSLYILWEIRQVLLLIFLAVVLATALNQIQLGLQRFRLKRFRLKRGGAVMLTVALTILVIAGFLLLVVPPFIRESAKLAELAPQSLDLLEKWFVDLQKSLPLHGDTQLLDRISGELQTLVGRVFSNFFAIFSNTVALLLNLLLVLVLTIMFVVNPHPYREGFVRLFPSFYRRRIDDILTKSEVALTGWLIGTLINMVVIGVASWLVLMLLQVRLVLANALLAGVLEAIPNIGPVLSVLPPMAIALLDDPKKALFVLIAYVGIQQLEQYLLVPTVMAKQVDLLPAVTLLSQVIFAMFFGFLGLLLALPLVIVLQIWIKEILVKDVLDHWQKQPQFAIATAGEAQFLPEPVMPATEGIDPVMGTMTTPTKPEAHATEPPTAPESSNLT